MSNNVWQLTDAFGVLARPGKIVLACPVLVPLEDEELPALVRALRPGGNMLALAHLGARLAGELGEIRRRQQRAFGRHARAFVRVQGVAPVARAEEGTVCIVADLLTPPVVFKTLVKILALVPRLGVALVTGRAEAVEEGGGGRLGGGHAGRAGRAGEDRVLFGPVGAQGAGRAVVSGFDVASIAVAPEGTR